MKKSLLFLYLIMPTTFAYASDCGIHDLNTSTNGTAYGYTCLSGDTGEDESTYGLTTGSGSWATEFSYGVVYGMANCNTTSGGTPGTVNNNLTTESRGQYCWCKATGFTASGNDYASGPQCTVSPVSSSWVFVSNTNSASNCALGCADDCADSVRYDTGFRSALYGAVPSVILSWYDNGSTISGPSYCALGGTFVPPTPPARPGYRFTGWKIKRYTSPTCGIPDLDTSTNGTQYACTRLNGNTGTRESTYGLTQGSGEWATEFEYGVVYGMANCNTTNGGTRRTVNNNLRTESSGTNCWCQATGFTPTSNDYSGGPQCTVSPTSSRWVYINDYWSVRECMSICALDCATLPLDYSDYRQAFFGAVGQ